LLYQCHGYTERWSVTAASGRFNGISITGVCPLGHCGSAFNYDNLYFWPAPNVDNDGIVVTLQNGDWLNICYNTSNCALPGGSAALLWDPNTGVTTFNADSVYFQQPVPEPSTLFMLGSGLLGVVGTLLRRLF
jgi:PEP-CTERM motif-containing protein